MKWCWEPRCFRRGNVECWGTSGCRMKGVRYCLALQDGNWDFPCDAIAGKRLILQRRWNHVVFLELRRDSRDKTGISGFLFGWPWEAQSSPRVRGKAGGCARVSAGPKRPHLGVCPGPNIPLQGRQGSWGCIPGSPGESGLVSRGSQGLRSPLESRRGSLGAP